ncbi:MAG: RNA polymerase sigma factor [Acidimicrobiia bacterium]
MTAIPFEQVVDEHGPLVLRVTRALLGPFDADDAWSDTFLAALEAYPGLRPGSDVRGWLVTIAHRKAIDRVRALSRAPLPSSPVPEPAPVDGTPADPDTELWSALRDLPFKQRAAVTYHYVAGLPYADVGALLDCTDAAARRSAADGIANLRRTYPRGRAS